MSTYYVDHLTDAACSASVDHSANADIAMDALSAPQGMTVFSLQMLLPNRTCESESVRTRDQGTAGKLFNDCEQAI